MKNASLFLLILSWLALGSTAAAADCVEVDIELTPVVVAGEPFEGYFELVNCGDEAAVIELTFDIQFNEHSIQIPGIPVRMGAGQTISKSFECIMPSFLAGNSISFCVAAVSGDATSSDCATMNIVEGSPDYRNLSFSVALSNDDCVEVELELPETVVAAPGSMADGYFELLNCGDEAALIDLEASLNFNGQDIGVVQRKAPLGASETISREFTIPVPPAVPAGTVIICVTATSGEAVSTSCQTVVIESGNSSPGHGSAKPIKSWNFPNPFNPSTKIALDLPEATEVTLKVYNSIGQEVRTLLDGRSLPAGLSEIVWDGCDRFGNAVSSGMYFYKIETVFETHSRKMVLLK
ncbi:MAG: T9SS type A sorting domain-containing protein [Candidatus Zixiibacteriota bacterium]|nr:MAG: T9SS type A sorting domain-containing protein [candidate division Zixibacteria bacterium]